VSVDAIQLPECFLAVGHGTHICLKRAIPRILRHCRVKDLVKSLILSNHQYVVILVIRIVLSDAIRIDRVRNLVIYIPLDHRRGDLLETLGLEMMRHSRRCFEEPRAVWTWDVSFIMNGRFHMLHSGTTYQLHINK
jgi:hypothetical protein